MPKNYQEFKVTLPAMESDIWSIRKFTVPAVNDTVGERYGDRRPPPGDYTGLWRKVDKWYHPPESYAGFLSLLPGSRKDPVMSDTPAEVKDHVPFIKKAQGVVLVAGLGLGMVTKALLAKPSVDHVVVVELDKNLINMVGPHYACDRLTIVEGSIFWGPDALQRPTRIPVNTQYDWAWFDIWDTIDMDNLEDFDALRDTWGSWCEHMEFWVEKECIAQARKMKAIWADPNYNGTH